MASILIVEDEENLRYTIRQSLTRDGHAVREASTLADALSLIEGNAFDLVLTDIILGRDSGLELIPRLREGGYDGALVVMTAMGSVETAVKAMRDGADDYLQKPLSLEELSIQVRRWLERQRLARRVHLYQRMEEARADAEECLGESDVWRETLSLAERLAMVPLGTDADGPLPSILLNGETGVGKGVMARYIHDCARKAGVHAPDTDPPLVHINCSALPPTLVEGELFGHEKGAFTDAREARPGLFEMADGGTIFLDEVTEMPLDLQAKLLLVVEQGTFRRVGGTRERTVRARVVAASNQDLDRCVEDGRFRRDLLYRLNTFTITIPPTARASWRRRCHRRSDPPALAPAIWSRRNRVWRRRDPRNQDPRMEGQCSGANQRRATRSDAHTGPENHPNRPGPRRIRKFPKSPLPSLGIGGYAKL